MRFGVISFLCRTSLTIFLSMVLTTHVFAAAKSQVVVSLQPLYLIAAEIGGEDILVERLLPTTASAHDFALKVSDHQKIVEADKVIWVGPELESFLQKALRNLPKEKLLELGKLEGIEFPLETGINHDHGHNHGDRDFHLWLDPDNAQIIARAVAQTFSQLTPEKASQFAAREQLLVERLKQLDAVVMAQLAPVKLRPFVVYHPAYDHFVSHYGLTQLNFVSLTPEKKAGARHLAGLQSAFKQDVTCLFTEPYQVHSRINEWAEMYGVRQAQLYPLGSETMHTFDELFTQLSQTFVDCLTSTQGP